MQRVDNDPTDLYVDGNPSTGTEGTRVMAAWLNAIQEELCYVIEEAGLALDAEDDTQLLEALFLVVAARVKNDIYGVGWNGDEDFSPSRNALYDKLNVIDKSILGDSVAGRVLRGLYIQIEDGTNATTIKPSSFSLWQGDANSAEDNLSKNGDTGNFTLSTDGKDLYLQASGLTGNCIAVLGGHIWRNGSGVDIIVQLVQTSSGIQVTFMNATTAAGVDLTTLVDTGYIQVAVFYLTSE